MSAGAGDWGNVAPDPRSGSQFPGDRAAWEGLVCAVAWSKGQFSLEAAVTRILEKEGVGDKSQKVGGGKRCKREEGTRWAGVPSTSPSLPGRRGRVCSSQPNGLALCLTLSEHLGSVC